MSKKNKCKYCGANLKKKFLKRCNQCGADLGVPSMSDEINNILGGL